MGKNHKCMETNKVTKQCWLENASQSEILKLPQNKTHQNLWNAAKRHTERGVLL
jgi:hypothetical protein